MAMNFTSLFKGRWYTACRNISRERETYTPEYAWHPGLDVYWQDNAWADTTFSVDWVNRTLASAVEGTGHFVLLVDNLTA